MDNQELFGLKELKSVVIRAYTDMRFGNKDFKKGEPLLFFDRLQIGSINQSNHVIAARGGWGNFAHVLWDQPSDLVFSFTEGVLSRMGLSILANAELFTFEPQEKTISVNKREIMEVRNGLINVLYAPNADTVFIYELDEDDKITASVPYKSISNKTIAVDSSYNRKRVMIDYHFNYSNGLSTYTISDKRLDGFLSLEAKANFKDDKDGTNKTFFLELPKIKITSNLDIRIGEKVSPTISVFNVISVPIKEKGHSVVGRMNLLNEDIDSDI